MSRCGRRRYDTTMSSVPCHWLRPGDLVAVGERTYRVEEVLNVTTVRISPLLLDVLLDELVYQLPAVLMALRFAGLLLLLASLIL